ncbi:winged helix-turn-helix transcriptional regulator [Chryseobacterium wangxinyae]|uniref:winged helix-turn-helix transcriptional regulator n=1 Tax=Chryseobacterium sp. CY353 TaxID=2997334 RepID=UPI00226E79FC|nr:helix-turn-helix domain-containing protein [Chryseobacterium sp. CY353]MCY0971111.1 helix-turn-helix domain-containing protein [Chryseobacterium sp. CY353]
MDPININQAEKDDNYFRLQQALHLKSNLDESCILNQSLTLIANKWTLLVLMALMQGTKRNSELQKQIDGISPKMLTQTLKILIGYGMVTRKAFPVVPPKVEYQLTEFGKSTADPLMALMEWSSKWEPQLTKLYKERL